MKLNGSRNGKSLSFSLSLPHPAKFHRKFKPDKHIKMSPNETPEMIRTHIFEHTKSKFSRDEFFIKNDEGRNKNDKSKFALIFIWPIYVNRVSHLKWSLTLDLNKIRKGDKGSLKIEFNAENRVETVFARFFNRWLQSLWIIKLKVESYDLFCFETAWNP